MRVSSFAVVAALTVGALAQSTTDLPKCATNCVGDSIKSGTGCPSDFDIGCICKSSQWIAGLACCVSKACQKADQDATIKYAQNLCAAYAKLPTEATCASNSTSAATTSSGSSSTGTIAVTSTSNTAKASSAAGASGSAAAAAGAGSPNGQIGVGLGMAAVGLFAVAL